MNKELYMRIKKLKDPTQAQPYCLRTFQEKELLKRAGKENLLYLFTAQPYKWEPVLSDGDFWCDTYILKPDYEPEPEYVDIEVVRNETILICNDTDVLSGPTSIHKLVARRDFVKFWFEGHDDGYITLESIATYIRDGHKVYARFMKE